MQQNVINTVVSRHTDINQLLKADYDGHDVDYGAGKVFRTFETMMCSIKSVEKVLETATPTQFVWMTEGHLDGLGYFVFKDDLLDYDPIMVDPVSARAFMAMFEKLDKNRRNKVAEAILSSRSKFIRLMGIATGTAH